MKKIIIPLIISVLCVGNSIAQDIYFGPKVGGNLSHILYSGDTESPYNNSKMRLSSHFGVFTEFVLSDFLSMQPELLYSVKGDRFTIDSDDIFESTLVFKYLSLPIVLKYYVTEEISIQVGPQVAYLLSAKKLEISEAVSTYGNEEEESEDLKDYMQIYDLGATAGVGYLTKSGFYLSARYNMGLINTSKDEPDFLGSYKNGTIQLSAGFSFR